MLIGYENYNRCSDTDTEDTERVEGGREEERKEEKGGGILKCKLCRKIGLLFQSATPYSAYPSYTVTKYFTVVCTIVTCIIDAS